MPTVVGILTFMSRINATSESIEQWNIFIFQYCILVFMSSWNFKLIWVEHEKSFITMRPDFPHDMTHGVRFPTMCNVRLAKAQTSLRIRAVWSEPLLVTGELYDYKATDWTPFELLNLTWGCTGSSNSINVKMPYCWKSHVTAYLLRAPKHAYTLSLGSKNLLTAFILLPRRCP